MALAALITSIVAVLVAGTSAGFTFWKARVNAARWRRERTPRFEADIEDRRSWYRLRLSHTYSVSTVPDLCPMIFGRPLTSDG